MRNDGKQLLFAFASRQSDGRTTKAYYAIQMCSSASWYAICSTTGTTWRISSPNTTKVSRAEDSRRRRRQRRGPIAFPWSGFFLRLCRDITWQSLCVCNFRHWCTARDGRLIGNRICKLIGSRVRKHTQRLEANWGSLQHSKTASLWT